MSKTHSRALYVHIPYCLAKCAYCDFNSRGPHPGSCHDAHRLDAYVEAIVWELEAYARIGANGGRRLLTCYIGGGTPTCLSGRQLVTLIDAIRRSFGFAPGYELTVEANPGTVDADKLESLVASGVNRLSIGIQSFNSKELAMLGRVHNVSDALHAFTQAREAGLGNVSLDLMYGLPGQEIDSWRKTLSQAVELQPDHISAYALSVEQGTLLEQQIQMGRLPMPNPDTVADMMDETVNTLQNSGYFRYEISNYAKPGMESRHNQVYWRYEPYIGIGAGACGFNGLCRYTNVRSDSAYITATSQGRLPKAEVEELSLNQRISECTFMNLRLTEGVNLVLWQDKFGIDFLDIYAKQIEEACNAGLMEVTPSQVRLTPKGIALSNRVFADFMLE